MAPKRIQTIAFARDGTRTGIIVEKFKEWRVHSDKTCARGRWGSLRIRARIWKQIFDVDQSKIYQLCLGIVEAEKVWHPMHVHPAEFLVQTCDGHWAYCWLKKVTMEKNINDYHHRPEKQNIIANDAPQGSQDPTPAISDRPTGDTVHAEPKPCKPNQSRDGHSGRRGCTPSLPPPKLRPWPAIAGHDQPSWREMVGLGRPWPYGRPWHGLP